MAGKESTLIIEADPDCEKCFKKIQKILCKLQTKENITKMDFDPKKNTITIAGPFDPERLSKKLRCKAGDAIKDIKPKEDKKAEPKEKPATPPPSTATTVNLQFTNICVLCYPWPCSDPTAHCGVPPPTRHHPPQCPPRGAAPKCAPCGGASFCGGCSSCAPKCAPCGGPSFCRGCSSCAPKCAPCGGPSFCGGCSSCRGHGGGGMHGWAVVPPPTPQLQPMCCPGPLVCRGCNGCRIVHESKFSYQEYPHSCAIM